MNNTNMEVIGSGTYLIRRWLLNDIGSNKLFFCLQSIKTPDFYFRGGKR